LKEISDGIYLINGSKDQKYQVDIHLPFCECKSHYWNRMKAFKKNEYPKDCKHIELCKSDYNEKNKNNKENAKIILSNAERNNPSF